MKCSICNTEITESQIKYGDANPVKRDGNGKIIARGFHHQCVETLLEKEDLAEENKKIEASEAAAYLGSIRSERKAASSAANGAKGGRPQK